MSGDYYGANCNGSCSFECICPAPTEAGDPAAWRDRTDPIVQSLLRLSEVEWPFGSFYDGWPQAEQARAEKLAANPLVSPGWIDKMIADTADYVRGLGLGWLGEVLADAGLKVRVKTWHRGDAEDQDDEVDETSGRYEGDLEAARDGFADGVLAELADQFDATLQRMGKKPEAPIYEDTVHAMQGYLDATGGPDRTCNFCLEPRSKCRQPDSYHSQVLRRDPMFSRPHGSFCGCGECKRWDAETARGNAEAIGQIFDDTVLYREQAPAVVVTDEALTWRPNVVEEVTRRQGAAAVEQALLTEAEWLGNPPVRDSYCCGGGANPGGHEWNCSKLRDWQQGAEDCGQPCTSALPCSPECEDKLRSNAYTDLLKASDQLKGDAGVEPSANDDDPVNHPSHYTSSPAHCSQCGHQIECIDVTRHMGFNLGNAVKYVWRCDLKRDAIEDLKKAVFYLTDEIARRERELDK